ncbi:MAG: hypothetical protein M1828_002329 [Chrysothrix sp. TS-e1954]|nr:MAG: hypothetical protein M1828_002329 [Chrysothrix sp. TS-e1954]
MSSAFDVPSLFNVEGMVAVITGGGSGLGLTVAKALDANKAAAVYIVGRREEVLKKAAAEGKNGSITPLVGDVTSKESLKAVATHVRNTHGYIDVLFANSGIAGVNGSKGLAQDPPPSVKDYADANWEPSMDDFDAPFRVNVTGVWYTALAFLELLDAGNQRNARLQRSQLIVTTSIAGTIRTHALGYGYGLSKAAATHFVKMLALDFAKFKIRVNSIHPGMYFTDMTAGIPWMQQGDPSKEGAVSRSFIPLERTGAETDMAGAALFLMSPAGAYVSGNVLVTDGGRMGLLSGTY